MTFDNNGMFSRELPLPLKYPENSNLVDNATGDIPFVTPRMFPEDPDEKIDITLNVSQNECTAIASALDIGRDIGYGVDSARLWFVWVRALREAATMSCEDVADCIETELITNIELQNSIAITVNQSGFGNPNQVNPTLTTPLDRNPAGALEEGVAELSECNLDALWGGIRHGIVARLDDKCRDMLEDLAAIPDAAVVLVAYNIPPAAVKVPKDLPSTLPASIADCETHVGADVALDCSNCPAVPEVVADAADVLDAYNTPFVVSPDNPGPEYPEVPLNPEIPENPLIPEAPLVPFVPLNPDLPL